ncbi:MAG: SET domain-containing protein [Bacteroidetes bacterium]|jgi:hypothetical protein|nr:SET domain-containing protein [Bacteroidota bacterium]
MIHPSTVLRFIDEHKGYGVFATEIIPKGTITYAKDHLEIQLTPEAFGQLSGPLQAQVEKYSYIDEHGIRIVSWDIAKYVNHCCNCNTMSTGYGFEIAIRDIQPGEEITDEYGLFNLTESMELYCKEPGCRKTIHPSDFELYWPIWDAKVAAAMERVHEVAQPLWHLLPADVVDEVQALKANPNNYRQVKYLKMNGHTAQVGQ